MRLNQLKAILWLALLGGSFLASPKFLGAQIGYSTDSSGNLQKDEFGSLYKVDPATGQSVKVELLEGGPSQAFQAVCPAVHILLILTSCLLVVWALWSMMQAAKGWGYDGSRHLRKGVTMLVVASVLLDLPQILSLIGLGYLTGRADQQAIWSCLWT